MDFRFHCIPWGTLRSESPGLLIHIWIPFVLSPACVWTRPCALHFYTAQAHRWLFLRHEEKPELSVSISFYFYLTHCVFQMHTICLFPVTVSIVATAEIGNTFIYHWRSIYVLYKTINFLLMLKNLGLHAQRGFYMIYGRILG